MNFLKSGGLNFLLRALRSIESLLVSGIKTLYLKLVVGGELTCHSFKILQSL